MDSGLTIAEIQARFQSEWVLVEDPQTNEALEVQSGHLAEENRRLRAEVLWLKIDWLPYNWNGDSLPWSSSPQ